MASPHLLLIFSANLKSPKTLYTLPALPEHVAPSSMHDHTNFAYKHGELSNLSFEWMDLVIVSQPNVDAIAMQIGWGLLFYYPPIVSATYHPEYNCQDFHPPSFHHVSIRDTTMTTILFYVHFSYPYLSLN
jgi:RNA polymerase subunit RPABC4/transcription elongation factor Spt4